MVSGPIESLISMWRGRGVSVSTRCWEHSRHVQHYLRDPFNYTAELNQFLDSVGLVQHDDHDDEQRHESVVMPSSKLWPQQTPNRRCFVVWRDFYWKKSPVLATFIQWMTLFFCKRLLAVLFNPTLVHRSLHVRSHSSNASKGDISGSKHDFNRWKPFPSFGNFEGILIFQTSSFNLTSLTTLFKVLGVPMKVGLWLCMWAALSICLFCCHQPPMTHMGTSGHQWLTWVLVDTRVATCPAFGGTSRFLALVSRVPSPTSAGRQLSRFLVVPCPSCRSLPLHYSKPIEFRTKSMMAHAELYFCASNASFIHVPETNRLRGVFPMPIANRS